MKLTSTFEWRIFWELKFWNHIKIHSLLKNKTDIKLVQKIDYYFINECLPHIIKLRKNSFSIKIKIHEKDGWNVFIKKKNYDFPIDNTFLEYFFPLSCSQEKIFHSAKELKFYLQENSTSLCIAVEKEKQEAIFSSRLGQKIKIELTKLKVNKRIFYSLCMESLKKDDLIPIVSQVNTKNGMICNYSQFLSKNSGMQNRN
ncbi:MAG: hypothetical protein MGG11_02895 [Trichodesmium sp. MAG_R03]|nr:hypothetical protein [Trichodesmium sp. MAG_R03]